MNPIAEHIIEQMMLPMATVFAICAMVALFGGWPKVNEKWQRPTRLQVCFAVALMINITYFVLGSLTSVTIADINNHWEMFLDWLCTVSLLAIPIQARYLRNKPMHIHNWLIVVVPALLDLVLIFTFCKESPWILNLVVNVFYIYLYIVYGVCMWKLSQWDRSLRDQYSDITHKQTRWFRWLTGPTMALILLWIPANNIPNGEWIWVVYYPIMAVVMIFTTSHILTQEEFSLEVNDDEPSPILYEEVRNSEDGEIDPTIVTPEWVNRLETAMTIQRIYRDANLTSNQLAREVGVNRTYLSQYINQSMGETFYNYVNRYRLEEAEKLLLSTDLSIDYIAQECGFTSHAAFTRYFKNQHGMTPTNYRRQNL